MSADYATLEQRLRGRADAAEKANTDGAPLVERFSLLTEAADAIASLTKQLEEVEQRQREFMRTRRWNVDEVEPGRLRVCRGEHEKAYACEDEYYVREDLSSANDTKEST